MIKKTIYSSILLIISCLADEHNKKEDPRYVAGLIKLKHIHGLGFTPNNTEWKEYQAIEKKCHFLDSSLMHLYITLCITIGVLFKDKGFYVDYLQEIEGCKEFEKTMKRLRQKYSK